MPSIATQPSLAVEATGLVKSFGSTRAVDGVDLAVPRGSVYGVLGPNGAGKTTTIRMLATLLRPDGGQARVLGHDVVSDAEAVRSSVSLTGQMASVDEDLTGRENLILLALLLGFTRRAAKARAGELLEAFGLDESSDKLVKHYSGGMRRRLDIAASIVVTPDGDAAARARGFRRHQPDLDPGDGIARVDGGQRRGGRRGRRPGGRGRADGCVRPAHGLAVPPRIGRSSEPRARITASAGRA